MGIKDWVNVNTQPLDLISSWETLNSVREVLQFVDPTTDEMRLSEYKYVIHETNRFMQKIRKDMLKIDDPEAAIKYLQTIVPAPANTITTRGHIMFQKFKQRWVATSCYDIEKLIDGKDNDE